MNNPESYQPTPDEIKKAEEMMTSGEKAMSGVREEYHNKRNEEGMEMPDNFKMETSSRESYGHTRWQYILSGDFKGHHFELENNKTAGETYNYLNPNSYIGDGFARGAVDGKPLTPKEAAVLWKKFIPVAISIYAESGESEKKVKDLHEQEYAEQERKEFELKREGIKDILTDFGV